MNKIYIRGLFIVVTLLACNFMQAQNCSSPTSLGTLGAPGACGSGIVNGATTTRSGTNVGVTPSDPYLYLTGCSMASPANDVWYTFVAPTNGYGINITVSGGTLANPNIALYQGTNCNTMTGISCIVGSGNTATLNVSSGIVPGDTYYIQVSGNTGQSGTYNLAVNAFQNCADCLNAASLTVSPLPVNGMYQPGQTVSFCFHIDQWTQTANNWLHGVQMSFGPGWNTSTLTTTPPAAYVGTAAYYGGGHPSTCGSWAYYPSGVTSSATGVTWPAGFYYNGTYTVNALGYPNGCVSSGDGNPGNNFGDGLADDGLVITPPANQWDFCWSITVETGCNPGVSLSVKVTTSGDGESGAWTSTGCANDPTTNFSAVISCCPPTMSSTATCTGLSTGTVTAAPQGSNGPYTYSWSPSSQTTSTITGVASGTYTVTVVDNSLCSATATASVTANALPVSNAGSNVSFCSGGSGSIGTTSTAGYTYAWSPTTGLNSSTSSNPTVTLTNVTSNPVTTAYTVTTTNTSTGCTSTASVNVTVNPLPTVAPTATPAAICNGQSTTLAANANAVSGTISTYAWSSGIAGNASGGSVSPTSNINYTVTVTNSNSCTVTGSVAVTVNAKPTAAPTAAPATICNGQSTTLAANATAGSGSISTYAWSTGLVGSVSGGSVSPVSNTTYTVTVTNSNSCTVTGTVAVTVNTNPNVAPTATPAAICNGQSTTLAANAVAGSGSISTYVWSSGLAGSVSGGSVSLTSNTTYTVTVTNSNNCTATGSVAVTVNANPTVAPTAAPATICNGQSTTLAANAVAVSGTISTYAWSTGLVGSVSGGSVSPVSNTTYTVTVTNSNSCTVTGTVAVTVNTNPNVAPTATPAAICNGQSTTLAANAVAGSGTISTYAWSSGIVGNTSGGSVSPTTNTTYTITVTNSNSCSATGSVAVTVNANPTVAPTATPVAICNGQSTTLAANAVAGSGAISTYAWSTGIAGSSSGGSVSPVANTTYTVTVTNSNSCTVTGSIAVTVNANPTVAPTATPAAICNGQSTTLAANAVVGSGSISTYAWSTGIAGNTSGGSVSPTTNTTYTITVTNSNSCSATGSVAVTVNANPTVASTATPAAICNGQSTTLVANAVAGSGSISTYAWSSGIAGNTSGGSVSPTANTTYTVTVTNSNTCTTTGSVAVTVNANPTVAPTATPAVICNGQSTILAANAVAGSGTISTYAWSTGLAGNVSGGSVFPVSNTMYTVTVTNSNLCSATGTVAVTVNANPNVAPTASPASICNGQSTTLAANAVAGSGTISTYAWSSGIAGNNSGGNFSPTANTTYTVTVTNSNTCTATGSVAVTVNANPTAAPTAAPATICNGQSTSLAANAIAGSGTINTYAWSTGIAGNSSGGSVSPTANATYTVTVTNSNGCTVTASTTVTVNPLPTPTATNTGPYCANSTIQLNASGGTVYSWSGPNTFSSNNQNPAITSATIGMTGSYSVTVTDGNGCSATASTSVIVNSSLVPVASNAGPYCVGTTIALHVTGGTIFSWSGPNAFSSASQSPTITGASVAMGGAYNVTATDGNGCSGTATTTVVVNPLPNPSANNTGPYCAGVSIQLNASGGTTYNWSGPNAFASTNQNPTITGSVTSMSGTYDVTVTDANGCSATISTTVVVNANPTVAPTATPATICNGQSTTLAANAIAGSGTISVYAWSSGIAGNTSGGSVSPTANTTYTVTITNSNSCTVTGSVAVTVNANPTVAPTAAPAAICNGQSTTLAANAVAGSGSISTYTWSTGLAGNVSGGSVSPVSNTTYTVTVTNSNSCSVTGSVAVTVNANPTVAPSATPAAICNGQSTTLAANAIAGSGSISVYAWSSGIAGNVSGGSVSPSANTTYTVTVTNSNNCSVTGSVAVTVNANPTAAPTASPAIICNGQSTTLTANATAGSGTISAYAWSSGIAGNSAGGSVSPTTNTTYTVTVTNSNSCTVTASTTITVNPLPVATATNTGPYCAGVNIQLQASGGTSYSWSGPNTFTSATQNPTITASTTLMSGSYDVTVTDANGCSATATTSVSVNDNPTVTPAATPAVICNGQSTTLSANATVGSGTINTYNWSSGIAGNTSGGSVSPTANTTYTVTVTNSNSCTATGSVAVTVNANPTVAPTATPAAICNGQSTTLAANAVAGSGTISTYAWSSGITGNASGGSVSPTANTTYIVTVTNSNSCTVTGSVAVTVNNNPTVAPTATPPAICNGQSTTLAANATAGSGTILTYNWSSGIAGNTSGGSVSPVANTTYTVTVTNSNSCTVTGSVAVTVNANPTVAPTATPATICNGQSTTLAANANAGSGTISTYNWSSGIAGNTSGGSVSPTASTTYTVTVTNSNSCSVTGSVAITVNANPTVAPTATPVTICNGQSTTLAANATAGSGTISTYNWSSGIAGNTSGGSVSPTSNTTYTVTVTNSNSCTVTGSVAVTVNPLPNATATNTGPYCASSTILLNSSGGTIYSWSGPNAFANSNQNPTITNATVGMTGSYTVTVTDANGCSATASTAVVVNSSLVPTASNTGAYCAGTTIQLNVTGGITFSWSGPNAFTSTNQNPTITGSTAAMSGSYNVTATDANGCSGTATTTVTVNPLPTPTATNTGPYCAGAGIQLNSSGGTTYNWSGPNAFASTGQNPTIGSSTITMSGNYDVTVTDGNGCSATTSTAVVVNDNPTVAPTANPAAICNGQSTTLAANATAGSGTINTYNWSSGIAGNTSGGSVSPTSNTTYTVTVTNSSSCTVTGNVSVTVNANPTAAPTATPATICNGQSTTLAANATAGSGTISTYNWSSGIAGNTSGGSVSPTSNTTYTVTVTNSNNCTVTASTVVTVNPLPVSAASNTGPYCVGTSIQLNASGGMLYNWGGANAFSSTNQNPSITGSTTAMAGSYDVTVTDGNGCSATATTAVIVNDNPTAAPTGTPGVICNGQSTTLAANATAGSGTISTYNWSSGIAGNTSGGSVSPTANTTYTVTVTNSNSCTVTGSVAVTVNANPTAAPTATPATICNGQSTTLAANATAGSGTISTYSWSSGIAGNSPGGSVSPTANATYTVTVTNSNNCTVTASTTVTVNPLPVPTATNAGPYCANSTIQLSASGGTIYSWSGPNAFSSNNQNPTITGATTGMTGSYSVTVTDGSGCSAIASTAVTVNSSLVPSAGNTGPYCAGTSIQLNVTGGVTFSWSGPNGYSSSSSSPIIAGATTAMSGSYDVTATDANGCSGTATTAVTVNPLPIPTATNTGPYCAGQDIQLNSSGGTVYNWSGPNAFASTNQNPTITAATTGMSGSYDVTVTDANGCSATTSTAVIVNANPSDAPTATPATICNGQSTTLAANAAAGSGTINTYNWSSGIAGNTSGGSVSPTANTTYTITVTNSNNCSITGSVTVTVNANPTAAPTATPATICNGQSTTLAANAIAGSGTISAYSWSSGIAGNTSGGSVSPTTNTTYTVTVTNSNSCTVTGSVAVTVNPLPNPTATNTGPYCAGAGIQLNSSGGTIYSWSGPNAFTSANQNPTIGSSTTTMSGSYDVTVTDANGCSVTTSTAVIVNDNPTVAPTVAPATICNGQSTILEANATAGSGTILTYSWSNGIAGNTSGGTVSPTANTTYAVTVTNSNSCSVTGSVAVTVNANPTVTPTATPPVICNGQSTALAANATAGSGTISTCNWSGGIAGNAAAGSVSPTSNTTYTVTVTNSNNCTVTGSVAVTVNPLPAPTAGNGGPYCASSTIQLNSSGGTIYSWSGPNAFTNSNQNPTIAGATTSMTGSYDVTVTDANGCTATASTSVIVNSALVPVASNTGPYCAGTTIQLSVTGGVNYSWSGPSAFTSTNQNPTITNSTAAMSGNYDVTATDANGCSGTATTIVTVNPLPVPNATNTGPYCAGSGIQLNSSGGTVYNWSGPNAFTSTNQNPTIASSTTTMSGGYDVTVTDGNGCSATTSTAVIVNDNPTAAPTATPATICDGQSTTLAANAVSGSGTISTYNWSSGIAGNTSGGSVSPTTNTTYTVTVTNSNSCTVTGSVAVTVNANPTAAPAATPATICNGQSTTLAANATAGSGTISTYNWSSGIAGNTSGGSVSPTTNTTYTVTVTNSNSCTVTASTDVTVNPLPSPTASNTGPYCASTTIQLNSSGGTIYSWSGLNAFANGNQNPTITGATVGMSGSYSVTVTDANGCSATASTAVVVNGALVPTASNTGPYCAGTTIQLNVTGGVTYNWGGPNAFGSTNQNPAITGSTTAMSGSYNVTATDANGCSGTATTTVTVNPLPVPTATNTSPYCAGAGIQLNSSGGITYSWSGPNAFTSTGQNPAIGNSTTAMSGSYDVTVTDGNGCSATTSTAIIVNDNPTVTPTATPATICNGQSTTLAANATAGSGTISTYNWSSGIAGNTSGGSISPTANTTYTLTVTNSNTCSVTGSVAVTVNANPTVNPTATPLTICNGQSTTLAANATAGSGTISTYSWSSGIAGNASTGSVSPTTNTTYTVTVTNSNSCTVTGTVAVTVNPLPSPTATNTGPYCVGASIQLNASGGTVFNWSGPNAFISANQNPTIAGATTIMVGSYDVTVTDGNGCSATTSTSVAVNQLPSPVAANTGDYCAGVDIQLSASGGSSYSWSGPNGFTSNNQNPLITGSTVAMNGTYSVTVTDANGCNGNSSTDVVVNAPSVPVPGNTGPYCVGATIMFTSNREATYEWSGPLGFSDFTPNPSIPNSTVAMSGVYSLKTTDANGCSATASTTVRVNPLPVVNAGSAVTITCTIQQPTLNAAAITSGDVYSWTGPGIVSGANTANPIVDSNGTYTLKVTDANSCIGYGHTTVNSDVTKPGIVAYPDTTLTCIVTSVQIMATSNTAGATFVWSNGAHTSANIVSSPAIYIVTATDPANGCTASSQLTVSSNIVTPNANAGPSVVLGCNVSSVELFGSSSTADVSYLWNGPGILIGGNTPNPSVNLPGTYSLLVTDIANGCTANAQTTVSLPVPMVTSATTRNNPCVQVAQGQIELSITGGETPLTYSWSNGATTQSITGIHGGDYVVTITDNMGCSVSASYQLQEGSFTVTAQENATINLGQSVQLTGIVTGGNGDYTYTWSPDYNLSCVVCQSPTVTPYTNMTYTLQVADTNGCIAYSSVLIQVNPLHNLYIPNAFTPNADGNNDYFSVYGDLDLIVFFNVKVFNRWGEKVFDSNDPHFEWDGTYRGVIQNPAVFVYEITATFIDGYTRNDYKGSITLIR